MDRHPVVFVSFFTPIYTAAADRLQDSLEMLGLSFEIHQMHPYPQWVRNTNEKPRFIHEMLKKHERVVWLDADAVVHSYPQFFEEIEDCWDASLFRGHRDELLSGTMYWRRSEATMRVMADWMAEAAQHPLIWDQMNLAKVIEKHSALRICPLPKNYILIFDNPRHQDARPAVIEHFQASRKHRKIDQGAIHGNPEGVPGKTVLSDSHEENPRMGEGRGRPDQ